MGLNQNEEMYKEYKWLIDHEWIWKLNVSGKFII